MFRYVTLNDNNTIDKESANDFDGAVKVWVADEKLSTYLYTPYLCWVEKVNDSYVIHIPDDAPRPPYEQKIEGFKNDIATLKKAGEDLKAELETAQKQLEDSVAHNKALVAQMRAMQNQNIIFAQQLSAITAESKKKDQIINSEEAVINQQKADSQEDSQSQAPASN